MVSVLLLAGSVSAETAVRVIELDGTWKISGYDESGTRRVADVDGRVPGQVHPDLQRAGLIPDPFWLVPAKGQIISWLNKDNGDIMRKDSSRFMKSACTKAK
jgi:hypothetical protein